MSNKLKMTPNEEEAYDAGRRYCALNLPIHDRPNYTDHRDRVAHERGWLYQAEIIDDEMWANASYYPPDDAGMGVR